MARIVLTTAYPTSKWWRAPSRWRGLSMARWCVPNWWRTKCASTKPTAFQVSKYGAATTVPGPGASTKMWCQCPRFRQHACTRMWCRALRVRLRASTRMWCRALRVRLHAVTHLPRVCLHAVTHLPRVCLHAVTHLPRVHLDVRGQCEPAFTLWLLFCKSTLMYGRNFEPTIIPFRRWHIAGHHAGYAHTPLSLSSIQGQLSLPGLSSFQVKLKHQTAVHPYFPSSNPYRFLQWRVFVYGEIFGCRGGVL